MDWQDEFAIGIPEIDAQHKALVDCITTVEMAVEGGSTWSAVNSALVVLNKYVEIHFAVEESLLRIHRYPDFDMHVAEHRRFAEKLARLQRASLEGDISGEMIEFLDAWIRGHILTHDRDYAWYVPQVGVKEPAPAWTAWAHRWRRILRPLPPPVALEGSAPTGAGEAGSDAKNALQPIDDWLEEWERVLAQRERELHEAQRLAGMGSWTWNLTDGGVSWSENQFRIFGLDSTTYKPTAEAYFDLVHPEERERVRMELRRLAEHPGSRQTEIRMALPNGSIKWINAMAESIADASGKVVLMRGTVTDITARIEAEQRARAADLHLRIAVESLDEYFVLCDPQDRIAVTNRRWRDLNREVADSTLPGTPFAEHLRAVLNAGLIPSAVGREEDWLRDALQRHRKANAQFVLRVGERRLLMRKRRLDDGSIITVGMDITDLEHIDQAHRLGESALAKPAANG